MLYDAITHQQMVGVDPIRKIKNLNRAKKAMGYLAYPGPGLKNEIPDRLFYEYKDIVKSSGTLKCDTSYRTKGRLEQSVSEEEYVEKIGQIKELLAAGEIYQMCYSIRFRKKFSGDPYALFCKLSKVNPVAFSAFFNAGAFQIISSSPERLFKVQDGKITTTPIKGTAPKEKVRDLKFHSASSSWLRGKIRKDIRDENLLKLLDSDKERAELDMITDLERNDVGKICEYGTLKLKKEREVLELKNLWHTYSEIGGQLRSDIDPEAVIEAMFPGGSITGCPKKRAMKYISELEGLPRNIFTGSIGYVKQDTVLEMDFNIAIRTILIKDGYMEFWAGGGIVADSDPESEYSEALLKAERFLDIIK